MKTMTTKERLLAAVRCLEVDYVPMNLQFYDKLYFRHEKVTWNNLQERLKTYKKWSWDTHVSTESKVSPSKEVRVKVNFEVYGDTTILHQIWQTPAGNLEERLKVTDDWEAVQNLNHHLPFNDDYRTSRYIEFPIKESSDLEALNYIFPITNLKDEETLINAYANNRDLANEFKTAHFVYHWGGMDWLMWLFPAEEAIMQVIDNSADMIKLLTCINKSYSQRLELLLDLGVDGVLRRGWYETTDFWSPKIFSEFAKPFLEKEIETTHKSGNVHIYIMCTGVIPLLNELSSLQFDCLSTVDPVLGGGQNLKEIKHCLPNKSIWGGISGPEHLAHGTPKKTEHAVERAFDECGTRGFILGPGVSIRNSYPWKNIEACEIAWKRLRYTGEKINNNEY